MGESQKEKEGRKELDQLWGASCMENMLNYLKHFLISHSGASTKLTKLWAQDTLMQLEFLELLGDE